MITSPKRCNTGKGTRNHACAEYMACLEHATAQWWDGFTCQGCPLEHSERKDWPEQQQVDLDGLADLILAVLHPSKAGDDQDRGDA